MAKSYPGEFEELMLTMVAILDSEAYGNKIVIEIKDRLNRVVSLSAVHITLYRLEDKGFLRSDMRGATTKRGGRRKRYFKITNAGIAILQDMKTQRQELWKFVPQLKMTAS